MEWIEATYLATRPDCDPQQLAENIAREQSLECPLDLIPTTVAERLLGRVLAIEQVDEQRWRMRIAYPPELAAGQVGPLLQLLYGNVSFYPRIRLVDLSLPTSLLTACPGPRAGLMGIRQLLDVPRRGLLLTVLKPRGLPLEQLADLAFRFASAGGDIVKDDQNLVESSLTAFEQRVGACARAVERAAEMSGRRCLYLPHVTGAGAHLQRQLDIVCAYELSGVVFCPWVIGLETASRAAAERDLLWLAHPAVAGTWTEPESTGIDASIVLGTLPRLAGADIVIYPGQSGRLSLGPQADEHRLIEAISGPCGKLKASLPASGGGKTLEQLPTLAASLGTDMAFVVGGDLLRRGPELEAAVHTAIAMLSTKSEQPS